MTGSTKNDAGVGLPKAEASGRSGGEGSAPEAAAASATVKSVALAGASGLIGRGLTARLQELGIRVMRLVRRPVKGSRDDEAFWDPAAGAIDADVLDGIDAVVNLAGENIAGGRWTPERKRRILSSRVLGTRLLVGAVTALHTRPGSKAPRVFVNASGAGWYGPEQQTPVDESAPAGEGFLAEVCAAWEQETAPLQALGVRAVCARFGVVLSREGGALKKMLPAFRLGLGGRLGAGTQYFCWVSFHDAVAAIVHALQCDHLEGPVNVVAPTTLTNAQWTGALGEALGRPTVFAVPAFALKLALGDLGEEALLGGQQVVPAKLENSGFEWRDREVHGFLRRELGAGGGGGSEATP